MLKSLHLKNWRSIRETTIEFSPITVLIGANASGKTNILDSLYFLRDVIEKDIPYAVYLRGESENICNLNVSKGEPAKLEFSYHFTEYESIIDKFELHFLDYLKAKRFLSAGNLKPIEYEYGPLPFWKTARQHNDTNEKILQNLRDFVTTHWQLLGENFMPPLTVALSTMRDLYLIESNASNTVFIVDFMRQHYSDLYEFLQDDLRFLLGHVSHISPKRKEGEVQIAFHENKYHEKEAPTVSAGTARILAVLAAVYALDMRNPNMSGLVVIEEPETSLNPSLLRKFVELLRGYTENAEKPRQFILTTHNPTFLNHFKPEEVRVVSRDEDGNTVVNPIPEYVREIWLPEHDLGDVWLTNAFGGVAE